MARLGVLVATATLLIALPAAIAAAQEGRGIQGPLGDPATMPAPAVGLPAAGTPAARTQRKARKHATKHPAGPAAETVAGRGGPDVGPPAAPAEAAALPTSRAERAAAPTANDPVSLGFKWQGSNDTAEKTRVQNYGGDAAGTGAAVGLNLHF